MLAELEAIRDSYDSYFLKIKFNIAMTPLRKLRDALKNRTKH